MEMNRQEIPEWLKESMAAERRYAEDERKKEKILYEQITETIKPIAMEAIQQEKVIGERPNDIVDPPAKSPKS